MLPEKGSLARLRLRSDPHSTALACRCRRIRNGDTRGILAVSLEAATGKPGLSALASFYADDVSGAFVVDEAGRVVASTNVPDDEASAADGAHVEIFDAGRTYRLYLIERAPPEAIEPELSRRPKISQRSQTMRPPIPIRRSRRSNAALIGVRAPSWRRSPSACAS